MPLAIVTGSAGLVGSATVALLCARGWTVIGIDNDQRSAFFGPAASTRDTLLALQERWPTYRHHDLDIRDAPQIAAIFAAFASDIALIVHAAAQPAHDWAATAPLVDFAVNAGSTLHLLEQTRLHCPRAVFIYVSTNKVYGDAPNLFPFVEHETRFEPESTHRYAARGIDESLSVDRCMHSLFGVSKLSADLMVQEYGRYFGLATACFRCGCITGGAHAAVEQHGFLAYVMRSAVQKIPYTIHGYQGKQVRDNIHADDLAAAFWAFYQTPRAGEVYNMGGGRASNCSVREAISLCEAAAGNTMAVSYEECARKGDHIWWISDTSRFSTHYPDWQPRHDRDSVIAALYNDICGR